MFESRTKGFSLLEVLIAIALVCIIAVGPIGFHHINIKQSRTADTQFLALRIAQLLIEDWKSNSGNTDYDPRTLKLGFMSPDYNEQGNYVVIVDNIPFYIIMQSADIEKDSAAGITLRQITVTVKWRGDYTRGSIRSYDPSLTFDTYVRRDQG